MATFLTFTPEQFNKLTSLEKALDVFEEAKWLDFKRSYLGLLLDEDKERDIYKNYHDLMVHAVEGKFKQGDYDTLQECRNVDPTVWDEGIKTIDSVTGQIHVQAPILKRSPNGEIIEIDLCYLDAQITAALFSHIFDVLVGRSDVRICEAEDCDQLFIPKRRHQKYHSNLCKQRQYRRRHSENPSS